MVAYLDSSLTLRYILKGETAIQHALACDQVVSSELMEIECRRVLHRCRMQGELDDTGLVLATERLEKLLSGISLIQLTAPIKKRAMEAFPLMIKTLDALNLATALYFVEKRPADTIIIFSHDESMNRCAKVLGFAAPLAQ
jgi:hypothetical protein